MILSRAPETAALPAKLEWPQSAPRSASIALADSALLKAWGLDYREGVDMCAQAASAGLNCWTARGGLDELRQLNRPAILHMRDDQGQEFHAVLTKLDNKAATFAIGNETRVVDLSVLANQWSGNYLLLWRLHPDIPRDSRSGESPSGEWLRKQLALAQGRDVDAAKDLGSDAAVMQQLKQFQLAHGLVPDGVAGLRTLMRLSGATDHTAPKLFTAQIGR
jgi:general secretion pathway protein A